MKKTGKIYILIVVLVTVALKIFYFNFYTISNDAGAYIALSEGIFKFHKITLDGVSNYLAFPPGYSLLLGLERIILLKYDYALFFNYVFITTLTSVLLIVFYYRNFTKENIIIFIPLALLYPVFITSNKLLSASSEYLYTFLLWLGIIYLYKFLFFKPKKIYLFLISAFFSYIYLIRPEGLLFLVLSLFIILYYRRKSFSFRDGLVFALPVFIFVFPYIHYLYNALGYITISFKDRAILEETKLLYPNKISLYISNIKNIFLLIIRPNFINPIVTIFMIYFLFIFKYFDKEKKVKVAILLIFLFSMVLVSIRYFVWARVLYPILPALLVITCLSLNHAINKYNLRIQYLPFFLSAYLVFCSFAPILKNNFYNDPLLYKRAGIFIKDKFGPDKLIMSRSNIIFYYAQARKVEFQENTMPPDFIVISNVSHVSLSPIDIFETKNLNQKRIILKGQEYIEIKRYGNDRYLVKIFKKT